MLKIIAATAVLVLAIAILPPAEGAPQRRFRRDTLTCPAGQTKIYTPYIYNYNANDSSFCGSVVRQLPFDYYNSIFRAECQRWLGSPTLPDQVGLSQPSYCFQFPLNGTAVYKMAVCCPGVATAVRCFSTNSDSLESQNNGTNLIRTIETCATDQVCQTQYTFRGSACTVSDRIVTKGCVAATSCQSAVLGGLCADYVTTPICTTCCNSSFCNYNINENLIKLPGACSSGNETAPTACTPNPCNNGHCSNNITSVSCSCRLGWTGTYCSDRLEYSSVNHCQNGGTCYNYLNGNYRCNCPTGFIGDNCQYTSSLTCDRSDAAFYEQVTETVFPITCDNLAATAGQYSIDYLDICTQKLRVTGRPAFVNGVNGQVDHIDQFKPQYCRHGEVNAWFKMHMCCPACLSVPCLNGGWCNDVLTTNSYVCVCPAGFSGLNCEHRVSLCIISGEPHYKTFDGQLLNYQGVCKHVLVEQTSSYNGSNPFQIYLRNEYRSENSQVSFPKDVLVDLCGDHVEILRNTSAPGQIPVTVKVNSLTVKMPYTGTCYSIEFNGHLVQLDSVSGIRIQFNGFWLVTIQVPDSYIGVTRGMCGNNNNNATDDLKTSNGTYVGGEEDPGRIIGNSYVVSNGSGLGNNQTECVTPWTNSTTCTDVEVQRRIAGRCSVITDPNGVFGSCIHRVGLFDAQLFYSSCTYDACHFDESSICLSFDVFALECFLRGVQVTWRNETGCQLQCPAGMIPSDDTCACQPTCDNPLASRSCRWPNTAMCVCPEGRIMSNGQCVTCCGCVDSSGIRYESGSQWSTSNCTKFECTPNLSTSPHHTCVSNITVVATSCSNGARCQDGNCIAIPTTKTPTTVRPTTKTPTTETPTTKTPTTKTPTTETPTTKTPTTKTPTTVRPTTKTPTTETPTTKTPTTETPTTKTPTTKTPTTVRPTTETPTTETPTTKTPTTETPTTKTPTTETPTTETPTTEAPTTTTVAITTSLPAPNRTRVCQRLDGGFCGFGAWSECVNGVQTRTRTCGCPVPGCFDCRGPSGCLACNLTADDGSQVDCPAAPCAGLTSENRNCGTSCPEFDSQVACSQCDLTVNPAGYVANPCNCTSFYQCVRVNGAWNAHQRPCPPCLCWDPVTMVCSNVADRAVPLTDPRCRPSVTEAPAALSNANCDMFSPASDPEHYTWIVNGQNHVMPCPSGTVFSAVACQCLASARRTANRSSRMFCLDFDNSNLLNGLYVSQLNLVVRNYGFQGNSAYFNGNSAAIEVPALTNVQLSVFTVSLWFRRVGTNTGSQGLVDSSDCHQNGSIHVISADQSHVTANLLTTGGYAAIGAQSAAYDAWNHVALSYDGSNVRMYVNNVLVSTVPATGPTAPTSCPLLFGHFYTSDSPEALTEGWFNGYMDNICFHREALSASQIGDLYNFIMA